MEMTPPYECRACGREWQDHPGVESCCKLASALGEYLKWALGFVQPPEHDPIATRDYYESLEEARRLVVQASGWKRQP